MTQRRSAEEFLGLFEPIRHELHNYARNALARPDTAADVMQDVALTAWREFPRYQPGSNFRAWLYRILLNTIFSWNRRTSRERRAQTLAGGDEAVFDHESEATWTALLEDSGRLREMLDARLAQAIDALGDEERQCLLLRLISDFSYREIGDLMQMPMGTAMSHVHRARQKLRERVALLAQESGVVREARR